MDNTDAWNAISNRLRYTSEQDDHIYRVATHNIDTEIEEHIDSADKMGLIQVTSHLPEITAMLTYSATIATMWRQPYMMGLFSADGGVVVYLILYGLSLVFFIFPIVLIENSIGRYVRKGVVESMFELGGKYYAWAGLFMAVISIGMSGYVSLIISWTMYYMLASYGYMMPNKPEDILEFFIVMRTQYTWYLVTLNIAVTMTVGFFMYKGMWVISVINTFISCPLLILVQLGLTVLTLIQKDSTFGLPIFYPNLKHFGDLNYYFLSGSQALFATSAGYGIYTSCGRYISASKFNVVKRSLGGVSVVLFFSMLSGPTTLLTVINGHSKLYEDKNGNINTSCEVVANEIRNHSIGLVFIAAHTLLGPMQKTGRSIAIVYFSCTFMVGIGILASLRDVGVRALQDEKVTRNHGIMFVSFMSTIVAIYHVMHDGRLIFLDYFWMLCLCYTFVFFSTVVVMIGVDKFRCTMVNVNSDDIYLPISFNKILYCNPILMASLIIIDFIQNTYIYITTATVASDSRTIQSTAVNNTGNLHVDGNSNTAIAVPTPSSLPVVPTSGINAYSLNSSAPRMSRREEEVRADKDSNPQKRYKPKKGKRERFNSKVYDQDMPNDHRSFETDGRRLTAYEFNDFLPDITLPFIDQDAVATADDNDGEDELNEIQVEQQRPAKGTNTEIKNNNVLPSTPDEGNDPFGLYGFANMVTDIIPGDYTEQEGQYPSTNADIYYKPIDPKEHLKIESKQQKNKKKKKKKKKSL